MSLSTETIIAQTIKIFPGPPQFVIYTPSGINPVQLTVIGKNLSKYQKFLSKKCNFYLFFNSFLHNNIINVLLYTGDSLFRHPFTPGEVTYYNGGQCNNYYNIGELINSRTERPMKITSFNVNGAKIASINETQLLPALHSNPEAILLIWDSDASSDRSHNGSPTASYYATLEYVIRTIQV